MKLFISALTVILAFAGCTPVSPYASYADVDEMLQGVDLEALNTKRVITCIRYGETQENGGVVRRDPVWIIAPKPVRDELLAQAAILDQTDPEFDWKLHCQPDFVLFAPRLVESMGGPQIAETALWYPSVVVIIDGEPVTVSNFDERRFFATCQPYRPDGFTRRSFIKAGC